MPVAKSLVDKIASIFGTRIALRITRFEVRNTDLSTIYVTAFYRKREERM
jgi:hypothetical protein